MSAARHVEYTSDPVLFLALELSASKWKVGTTVGLGQKPREITIEAGDLDGLTEEIARAKERFGLPAEARVVSCYEAGRDGFWIHRWIETRCRECCCDPASVQVDRRKKRAKTDRLDLGMLLRCLIRWFGGEPKVWSVVQVPTVKDEDDRQLHRELRALKNEQARHTNRIKSLLISQGVKIPAKAEFVGLLRSCRVWDGSPLPKGLLSLEREYRRFESSGRALLEKQRREALRESPDEKVEKYGSSCACAESPTTALGYS